MDGNLQLPKNVAKIHRFWPFQYGNHLVYQRFWPFWTFISNKWWFPKIGNWIDWKFGGLKFEAGLKQRPFFWGGTSPPTVDHPSNTHRHQTRSSNTCATKIIKICDCVYTDVYIYIYIIYNHPLRGNRNMLPLPPRFSSAVAKSALILRDQRRCGRVVLKDFPGPLQVIKTRCLWITRTPLFWPTALSKSWTLIVLRASRSTTTTKACRVGPHDLKILI